MSEHTLLAQLTISDQNRVAAARARWALAGGVLHVLHDDRGRPEFIATKWHLSKSLPSIGELEHWLDRVLGVSR